MPSKQATLQAIRSRFKTLVQSDASNPFPGGVAYENMDFNGPQADKVWAAVFITPGQTHQVSMGQPGGNRWRTPGIMTVCVMTPTTGGTKTPETIIELITAKFQGQSAGGVVYRSVSLHTIGVANPTLGTHRSVANPSPGSKGAFWRTDAVVSWYSDELR